MIDLFDKRLDEIDAKISAATASEIPALFFDIPLDIFGYLLLDVPDKFPHIKAVFPSMPSNEEQAHWTGCHGVDLLTQSLSFVKTVLSGYSFLAGRRVENSDVLDFGCGWGRILRLFYKLVSSENLYAVDPLDASIELCRRHGVLGQIQLSEYVATSLPFQRRFDLIYACSVFTHLSEKTTHVLFDTLRRHIQDGGVLALTVRPKEYWQVYQDGALRDEMIQNHDGKGFAFVPHDRPPVDGDITYGDTSISLDYIREHFPEWRLALVEYNLIDRYQVVLFLTPRS